MHLFRLMKQQLDTVILEEAKTEEEAVLKAVQMENLINCISYCVQQVHSEEEISEFQQSMMMMFDIPINFVPL
jgi:hypothetical protein